MDPPQAAATNPTARPRNREASSSSLHQAFPTGTPGRQVFPLIDGFTGEIFTVDLRHPLLAASARRADDSTFFPTDVHPTWNALRQFLFTRVLPALPSKLHASLPSPTTYTFCNTSDEHRPQTERPVCHPGHSAAVLTSSGCIDRSSEFASHPRSSRQLGGTLAKNSVVLLLECTYTSLDLEVKRHSSRSDEEASSDVLRPGEPGPIFFYYSDLIFYFCRGEQSDNRELGAVDGGRESSQPTSHSEFLRAREATQNRNDADELAGRQGIASAPASALSSPYLHAYDSQASRSHLGRRDSFPSFFGATASGDSWDNGRSPGSHPVVSFRLPYASPSLERRLTGAEQCAVQTAAALCADTGLQHFASSVRTAAHLLAAGRARAAAAASLLQRLPQQRQSALVVQGNLERHLELATSWLAALLRRVEDERRLQQPLIDGLDPLLNLLHSTVLPKSLQKPKQLGQTAAASSKSQPVMRTLADALDIETVHCHVDRVIAQREQVYGHLKALQSRCDEAALEASAAGRRAVSVAERAGAVEEEALRIEAAGREHEVLFHRVLEALPPPPIAYSQYSPEQLEGRRERQTAALQELRKIASEQASCEERLAVLWARRGEEFARAVSRVFEGKMEVKREHNLGLMLREAAQRVAVAVLQFGRLYALPRACALALQECARRRRFRCTYTSAAKSAQTQLDEMRLNEEELRLGFLESCGHALPLSLFGALRQYEVPRVAVEGPEDFDTDLEMIGGGCDEPDSIEFRIQDKDDDSSDSGFGPPDKVNNNSQPLYTFGVQTVARATYPTYHGQQGRKPSNRRRGGKTTTSSSNSHEDSEENRVEKKLLEASTSESLIAATAAVEALLAGMLRTGAEEERDVFTRAAKADLQDLLSQWRLEATVDKDHPPVMEDIPSNLGQERRSSPLGVTPGCKSDLPLFGSSDQKTCLLPSSSSCPVYGIPTIYEESEGMPLRPFVREHRDPDDVSMVGRSSMQTRITKNARETTTTGDDGRSSSVSSLSLPSKDRTAMHARQVGSLLPPESKEKPRIRIRSPCLSPVDREARMEGSQLREKEVSEDHLSSTNSFYEERDGHKLIAYDREGGEAQGEGTTSISSSSRASLMSSFIGSSSSPPSSSSSLEREKKDNSSSSSSSLRTDVASAILSSSFSSPLPGNEDRPESFERREGSSGKQAAGISDRFNSTTGKEELPQSVKEGDEMGTSSRKKEFLSLSSGGASLAREPEKDRKLDSTEGFEAKNTQTEYTSPSGLPSFRFGTGAGYTRCISSSTPFSLSSSLMSDSPNPAVSLRSSGSIPSSSSSLLPTTAQGTLSFSTFSPSSFSTSSAACSASHSSAYLSSSSVSAVPSSLSSLSASTSPALSTLTEGQRQSVASTIPSAPARTSVSASCSASVSSSSLGSSSSSLCLSSSAASSSSLSYLASSSTPSAKAADVLSSSFSLRDASNLPSSSSAFCFSSVASMSSSISLAGVASHEASSSCLSPPIRQSCLRVSGPATAVEGHGHQDVPISSLLKRESFRKDASFASVPLEKLPGEKRRMSLETREAGFFSVSSDEEQKEKKSLLSDFHHTGSSERRLTCHSSPRDAQTLQTDDSKHEGIVSDQFSESPRKETLLLQQLSVSAKESLTASDSHGIGSQVQRPGLEKIERVCPVFSFDVESTDNLGREHEIPVVVADREQREMGEPVNLSSPSSSSSDQSFERRSSSLLKAEEEKALPPYGHTSPIEQKSSSDSKSGEGKEEEKERSIGEGGIPPRDVSIDPYEAESSLTVKLDSVSSEITKQKQLDSVSPVRSLSLKLEALRETAAEKEPAAKPSCGMEVELNGDLHGGGSYEERGKEEANHLLESRASNGETCSIVVPVQLSGSDRSEHGEGDRSGIVMSSEETPEERGWLREEKQTGGNPLTANNVGEGHEVRIERDEKRKEGEVEVIKREEERIKDTGEEERIKDTGEGERCQSDHRERGLGKDEVEEANIGSCEVSEECSRVCSKGETAESTGVCVPFMSSPDALSGSTCVDSASCIEEAAGSGVEEKPTTTCVTFDSDKSVSAEGQQEVSLDKGKKSWEATVLEERNDEKAIDTACTSRANLNTEEELRPKDTPRGDDVSSSGRGDGGLPESTGTVESCHSVSSMQEVPAGNDQAQEGRGQLAVEQTLGREEHQEEDSGRVEQGTGSEEKKTELEKRPNTRNNEGVSKDVINDRQGNDFDATDEKSEGKDSCSSFSAERVSSKMDREEGNSALEPVLLSSPAEEAQQYSQVQDIEKSSENVSPQGEEKVEAREGSEHRSFLRGSSSSKDDEGKGETEEVGCVVAEKDKTSSLHILIENKKGSTPLDSGDTASKKDSSSLEMSKNGDTEVSPESLVDEKMNISATEQLVRKATEEIDNETKQKLVIVEPETPVNEGLKVLAGEEAGTEEDSSNVLPRPKGDDESGCISPSQAGRDRVCLSPLAEQREGQLGILPGDRADREVVSSDPRESVGRSSPGTDDRGLELEDVQQGRDERKEVGAVQDREPDQGSRETEGHASSSRQVSDDKKNKEGEVDEDLLLASPPSGVVYSSCLSLRGDKEEDNNGLLPANDYLKEGLRAGAAA